MKKFIIIAAALAFSIAASAQSMEWSRTMMDGSRTGCQAPGADNVAEALGTVKGNKYYAPNGKVYKKGCTPKIAKDVIDVQPEMADLKQVVGYCPDGMKTRGGNSPLANFATDVLLQYADTLFGHKADIAVLNAGGIRADVPAGDVLKDDMVAVFPFHNHIVLVEYPGTVMQEFLESQAEHRPQPFSGAKLVIENRKLVSATVGGEPVDPNKTYYMVTIDFLLGAGDNMRLAKGATNIEYTKVDVIDVILDYMLKEKAAGHEIVAKKDDRVTMIGEEERR